mmetsp:Transcript_52759/g.105732  ORF Transcript_52759/g.105732 Transcript_52759/m.105732 type:complete len:81 (+) Transcript_52759:108-350(+)
MRRRGWGWEGKGANKETNGPTASNTMMTRNEIEALKQSTSFPCSRLLHSLKQKSKSCQFSNPTHHNEWNGFVHMATRAQW